MAIAGRSDHLPFVVRWIGRFGWNRKTLCELSRFKRPEAARADMLRRQREWEAFFGQPFPIGIWQVIDIRDGTVVAESE